MEFITAVGRPEAIKTDAIVVGVHADGELTPTAKSLDAASKGAIKAAVKSGDMTGKRGALLPLLGLERGRRAACLVDRPRRQGRLQRASLYRCRARQRQGVQRRRKERDGRGARLARQKARRGVAGMQPRDRRARNRVSHRRAEEQARVGLQRGANTVGLLLKASNAGAERGLRYGGAIANGMELTKRLGNLPPNICTPSFLADEARKMAKKWKLDIEVLEAKQLEALKMGSFLSVAKGSAQPPRLIVMKYKGAAKGAPIVLVGKGITFDSGGISLKPGAAMDEMKFDMCGAASVIGTMRALAELKLKINVVGVVAACENMPSGAARQTGRHRDVDVRPDDRGSEHRR